VIEHFPAAIQDAATVRSPLPETPPGPGGPLACALRRKAEAGGPGSLAQRILAAGDDWQVVDLICTCGPGDRPFEEQHDWPSISLVLSGGFAYRSHVGESLFSPGAWLLMNLEQRFECSHRHGEGDRCLSFQFAPALFERVARDAGARRARFERDRLPPLRQLAPLTARAAASLDRADALEEVSLEVAAAVLAVAAQTRAPTATRGDFARVAFLLRRLESDVAAPHSLEALAGSVDLSPYHFVRVFREATGITPHQWLVRARLRCAAHLLATTRQPVTEIALDVGFEDLSNFIRSFKAEFGASPRRYRHR